jgi:hypothetical protein
MMAEIQFLTGAELNLVNDRIPLVTGERARFLLQDIHNPSVFPVILVVVGVSLIGDIDPDSISNIIFRHGFRLPALWIQSFCWL